MKFLIVCTLMPLTLIVGSLVTVAGAQTNEIAKFNVPFAFVVGNQTLPAEEYSVGLTDTHVLVLRGERGRFALVSTSRFDLDVPSGRPSVQFEVVDAQHILTRLEDGNDSGGRVVLRATPRVATTK